MTATPRLEDFYDVAPVEVVLVGGRRAGERMLVPEPLPFSLVLRDPEPEWMPPVAWLKPLTPGEVPEPACMTDRTTVYQRTGSVRDDGARVYAALDGRRRR